MILNNNPSSMDGMMYASRHLMINIYEDGFSQFALAELEKKREREPTSSCFQVMIIDDDWSTIQLSAWVRK